MTDEDPSFTADAIDRHAALTFALQAKVQAGFERPWEEIADHAYRWLRSRDTLRAVTLQIVPGTPWQEGTPKVAATMNLEDTQEVTFTLTGQDAKGASVALDSGFSAAWSLDDPGATGATLTPSADTTSATLAAGTPGNVTVNVTVTNPDGSTLTGAEAVVITAGPAVTVGLMAGTPSDEPAPAPAPAG